jgi:hypothetical protein
MLSLYHPYQSSRILIRRLYRSWSVLRAQDVVSPICAATPLMTGTKSCCTRWITSSMEGGSA